MQLYKTQAGAYLGFYQEQGGAVVVIGHKDVITKVITTELITETFRLPDVLTTVFSNIPGHFGQVKFWVPEVKVQKQKTTAGYWDTESVYIEGHYETKEIWIPAHDVQKFVEVPGYFEDRLVQLPGQYVIENDWVEGFYVTQWYWQEPHPVRGLPGMWKEYQHWIPAGYKETRKWIEGLWVTKEFWVDKTYEYKTVTIPGQFTDHRVWIDGNYEDRPVWVPPTVEMETVTIAGHFDTKQAWIEGYVKETQISVPGKLVTKEHLVTHEKTIITEVPIYAYYGPNDKWDMINKKQGPAIVLAGPWEGDELTIRVVETGAIVTVEAQWVGLAEKTDDNEYIIPGPKYVPDL